MMNQTRSFQCESSQFPELLSSMKGWFQGEGFRCQQLETEHGGVLLQVEKEEGWRKAVGMSTALNVVFTNVDNTVNVEIGAGRWIDKAAVGAISFFILWPLAITSGIGAWQQMKMPERVFQEVAAVLERQKTTRAALSDWEVIDDLLSSARTVTAEERSRTDLEKAIALCDSVVQRGEEHLPDTIKACCRRAEALWLMQELPQAKEDLTTLLRKHDEGRILVDKQLLTEANQLLAQICSAQHSYDEEMIFLGRANINCSDEIRRKNTAALREARSQWTQSLRQRAPSSRTIIFCTDDIPCWKTEVFCFCDMAGLQKMGWKFQVGHPQANQLYICHPLHEDMYYCVQDFHDKVFEDKQSELIHLLQSLGANAIHVEACSDVVEKMSSSTMQQASLVDDTILGVAVTGQAGDLAQAQRQAVQSGVWDLELKPVEAPRVPDDLVWYHHEPAWQRIAGTALSRACRKVTVELRYEDDFSINASRMRDIEAGLQLFGQKEGIHWSKEAEELLQQQKRTVWKFTALFPESSGLTETEPAAETFLKTLSPEESEYADQLKECVADGVITDDARRLLERYKKKAQISDARASEIEANLVASLHPAQKNTLPNNGSGVS